MANNDDNNDGEEQLGELPPMSTMRRTKRLLSQIPLPSTGLILRQLSGGNITVTPVKKRRTVSEQINPHDR
jgi:hypothetical protein